MHSHYELLNEQAAARSFFFSTDNHFGNLKYFSDVTVI